MRFLATWLFIVSSLIHFSRSDITVLEPAPNDVFKPGGNCTISWGLDPTGLWTQMTIQLMTGPNAPQVPLKTLTTVDATKTASYSYICPSVSPNAAIYFYQFSNGSKNLWTGRFVITNAQGTYTNPPEQTQPDGEAIPWGTGTLVGGTTTNPTTTFSSVSTTNTSTAPATPTTTSTILSTTLLTTTTTATSTSSASPTPSSNSKSFSSRVSSFFSNTRNKIIVIVIASVFGVLFLVLLIRGLYKCATRRSRRPVPLDGPNLNSSMREMRGESSRDVLDHSRGKYEPLSPGLGV